MMFMFKGTLTKFAGHRENNEEAIKYFYTNRNYNDYFELHMPKTQRWNNTAVLSTMIEEIQEENKITGAMIFASAPFTKVNTRKTSFGDIMFDIMIFRYINFSAELNENGEIDDICLLEQRLATDDEICEAFRIRCINRKKLI